MNVILYFKMPSKTDSSLEKLTGAREIAARARYHIEAIETPVTAAKIRQLVEFWKPAGILVECGERTRILPIFDAIRSRPVVFIDRDDKHRPKNAFAVIHDSYTTGMHAAHELMASGYEHFAFIPFLGTWRWNEERQHGFLEGLNLNGKTARVFKTHAKNFDAPIYTRDLRAFLVSLPKPCGVFVANDLPAEKAIGIANRLHLAVPKEIAFLGVDDDRAICEHTHPTLSSIKPDFRHGGNLAIILLLAAIREGKHFHGGRIQRYGDIQITHRESLLPRFGGTNPEVIRALQLIRNEATNGLTAEQVMQTFSCSRMTAAARFRTITGQTILEAIHAVRLKRIKELLADPHRQLKVLHDFCGFKSANSLRKFFRRATGKTLSEWRKKPNREFTVSSPR